MKRARSQDSTGHRERTEVLCEESSVDDSVHPDTEDDEISHDGATSYSQNAFAPSLSAAARTSSNLQVDSKLTRTKQLRSIGESTKEPGIPRHHSKRFGSRKSAAKNSDQSSGILDAKVENDDRRLTQSNGSSNDVSESDETLEAESPTGRIQDGNHTEHVDEPLFPARNYYYRNEDVSPGAYHVPGPWVARQNSDDLDDEENEAGPQHSIATPWELGNEIQAELVNHLIAERVSNRDTRKKLAACVSFTSAVFACLVVANVVGLVGILFMSLHGGSPPPSSSTLSTQSDEGVPSFVQEASRCFDSYEQLLSTLHLYVALQERLGSGNETGADLKERDSIAENFGWPIGAWCTSKITHMTNLFASLANFAPAALSFFNEDISRWDVSHVTTFAFTFSDVHAFNQPLNSWNVSRSVDMRGMFRNCLEFNQPLHDWQVSKVIYLSATFEGAQKFNQDLSSWDVSSLADMSNLFEGCLEFNQPLKRWNVSRVKGFFQSFAGAQKFDYDLSAWDVSSATSLEYTFSNCNQFNKPLKTWNVSKVINFAQTFSEARMFNQDLALWDVSGATNMEGMFAGARAFNGDVSRWDVSTVTTMDSMFLSASSFNQDVSRWNVDSVVSFRDMFDSTGQFNQNLSSWNTSLCTDMAKMFFQSGFNSDISGWETSSVIDMSQMFDSTRLFNSDISQWNTSSLMSMNRMFYGADRFNVDVSAWNVSLVIDFESAFQGARSFSQDLCAWGPRLYHSGRAQVSIAHMFDSSNCNVTDEPNLDDTPTSPLCFVCG